MMVPNYVYSILLACALGACDADDECDNPKCICKPTMKMEWQPTTAHSVCNNATFDWMLHTLLSEMSTLRDLDDEKERELQAARETVTKAQQKIINMKKENANHNSDLHEWKGAVEALENQKAELQDQLDELRQLDDERVRLKKDVELLNRVNEELREAQRTSALPKDCADIQRKGSKYSGLYTVYPQGLEQGLEVFCDLNTDNGGWTLFQRRQDGSHRFDRDWDEYRNGFGQPAREFWLGNENVYRISVQQEYELRVELMDHDGSTAYATYDSFELEDEEGNYTLHVGGYAGDAGNALDHHNGSPFSTKDVDNDKSRSGHCSRLFGNGGWWFVRCYDSNLNGVYMQKGEGKEGIVWFQWGHKHISLKHVEMKIRPRGFGEN